MRIDWRPADEELTAFIHAYLDSLCTWEMLLYFAQAPDATNTVETLASRVGRAANEVAGCVQRLSEEGLLDSVHAFDETVYRVTHDAEKRVLLKRFADTQREPGMRVEALRWVMSRQES